MGDGQWLKSETGKQHTSKFHLNNKNKIYLLVGDGLNQIQEAQSISEDINRFQKGASENTINFRRGLKSKASKLPVNGKKSEALNHILKERINEVMKASKSDKNKKSNLGCHQMLKKSGEKESI